VTRAPTSAARNSRTHLGGPPVHSHRQIGILEPAFPDLPASRSRLAGRSPGLTSAGRPGSRTRAGHPERPVRYVRRNAFQPRGRSTEHPTPPHPTPSGRPPTPVTLIRNQQRTHRHLEFRSSQPGNKTKLGLFRSTPEPVTGH